MHIKYCCIAKGGVYKTILCMFFEFLCSIFVVFLFLPLLWSVEPFIYVRMGNQITNFVKSCNENRSN